MNFLNRLLDFSSIVLQCHDMPDADTVAAAFGLYRYLTAQGKSVRILYGGDQPIRKSSMQMLIGECGIPIVHARSLPPCDLLVMVDCQYDQGNAQAFAAPRRMVIDHHIQNIPSGEDVFIRSEYQSCSTLVYELLLDAGYDVLSDAFLCTALLYGLYTDTSCFMDLFRERDSRMKSDLLACDRPLFERLVKSNMTVTELLVAADAMRGHYLDESRRLAIIEALECDQTVLGIIGDFVIQVDAVDLTFTYTLSNAGYQISVRSCGDKVFANAVAAHVCQGIGSGGGHAKKAGGYIPLELYRRVYGDRPIFDTVCERLCRYLDGEQ